MGMRRAPATLLIAAAAMHAQAGGELRFSIRADPRTFDPLLASEEVSDTIRYLTSGVLIRFNRQTQRLEPELASSWKISRDGKRIDFDLRPNIRFSDGAPFGPADVIATVRRLMTPGLQSGIAEAFRSATGAVSAVAKGPNGVSITFSTPVGGLELLFDQLPILSSREVPVGSSVLGPFVVAEHRGGQYVLLKRNPNYWKTISNGSRLPRVDSVRLEIQANRETELLRFRRGELHFIDKLEPDGFDRLKTEAPATVRNAGSSLDSEFLWFNQRPTSSIPAYKTKWFQSVNFRRAVSAAIRRSDIIRLVYRGYAHPAAGPISDANHLWFNTKLAPPRFDVDLAMRLLRQDGFRLEGGTLKDSGGNTVEWSLITNAGSKTRSQIGTIIQDDLRKIGIRVNFQPMEFQSLIERITRTNQYEACLLGLAGVEIDPNSQINVWMSSGTHHAWNPAQLKPATEWEAEIDRLMQEQHSTTDAAVRKRAFDRVQEIASEQQPIIYLVHPDVLVGISPVVRGAAPSPLPPHLYWNIETVGLVPAGQERRN